MLTLDERIALLEAELARESSDSDSDGSDDDTTHGTHTHTKSRPGRPRLARRRPHPAPAGPFITSGAAQEAPLRRAAATNEARHARRGLARASPAQLQQAHRLGRRLRGVGEGQARVVLPPVRVSRNRPRGPRAPPAVGPPHGRDARLARPVLRACRVQTTSPNELAVHLTQEARSARRGRQRRGRGGGRGRGGRGRGRGGRFSTKPLVAALRRATALLRRAKIRPRFVCARTMPVGSFVAEADGFHAVPVHRRNPHDVSAVPRITAPQISNSAHRLSIGQRPGITS